MSGFYHYRGDGKGLSATRGGEAPQVHWPISKPMPIGQMGPPGSIGYREAAMGPIGPSRVL
jgi:hypothetical protein